MPVSTTASNLESRYSYELETLRHIGVKIVECDTTESLSREAVRLPGRLMWYYPLT